MGSGGGWGAGECVYYRGRGGNLPFLFYLPTKLLRKEYAHYEQILFLYENTHFWKITSFSQAMLFLFLTQCSPPGSKQEIYSNRDKNS